MFIVICKFRIDYSTLFSIFDMAKLKKPMERIPLNQKNCKVLKSDLLKTNQHIAPQCRQILQTFVWWGPGTNLLLLPPTQHHVKTSVNFCNFTELYLGQSSTNPTFRLCNFSNLKVFFPQVSLAWPCQILKITWNSLS